MASTIDFHSVLLPSVVLRLLDRPLFSRMLHPRKQRYEYHDDAFLSVEFGTRLFRHGNDNELMDSLAFRKLVVPINHLFDVLIKLVGLGHHHGGFA